MPKNEPRSAQLNEDKNGPRDVNTLIQLNETSETDKISECGICSGEVGAEDQAVNCDGCGKWVHINCGKITSKLYNKIKHAPLSNPVTWYCTLCSKDKQKNNKINSESQIINGPIPNIPQDTSQTTELKQTKEILTNVMAQNESLQQIINNLQSDLEMANKMLIHSKQENILVNQELISQTHLINRLNKELHIYRQKIVLTETVTYKPESTLNLDAQVGIDTTQHVTPTEKSSDVKQDVSPVDKCDPNVLIIGDSMLQGIREFSRDPQIDIQFFSGARIQDLSKFLTSKPKDSLPNTVIVHIGTNNVKYAATPNHLMRPLWLTLESAKKKFKNTLWIVNGIIHRRDVQERVIREANDALAFMCDQLKIVYRDPNTIITERGLARDGLHLNRYGSKLLAEFILTDVRPMAYHDNTIETNTPLVSLNETPKN